MGMGGNTTVNENKKASGSVGVCGLLGVAFVVLKLCGVIDWPWLWVTSPFWLPFAVGLVLLAIAGVAWKISKLLDERGMWG